VAVVVVPYVEPMLNPATRAVVQAVRAPHLFVQLDRGDVGAYGRLFRKLWGQGHTFVICEQDVIPTRAQLVGILTCGHDWCCYDYDTDLYPPGPMFGLVRFSAALMGAHPHAADSALVVGKRRDLEAPWWHIDSLMARDLTIRLSGAVRDGESCAALEGERHPWRRAGCVIHTPPVQHAHVGVPSGPLR